MNVIINWRSDPPGRGILAQLRFHRGDLLLGVVFSGEFPLPVN